VASDDGPGCEVASLSKSLSTTFLLDFQRFACKKQQPFADPLWERAMRAKNRGHGLGVPARSHRYCINVCFCVAAVSLMSPKRS